MCCFTMDKQWYPKKPHQRYDRWDHFTWIQKTLIELARYIARCAPYLYYKKFSNAIKELELGGKYKWHWYIVR